MSLIEVSNTRVYQSSSPGPNIAAPQAVKQARSRKTTTQKEDIVRRAESAGGIITEKKNEPKNKSNSLTAKSAKPAVADTATEGATNTTNLTRRKPRKLNKAPTSTTVPLQNTSPADLPINEAAVTELEALKSRVRGLEAKVEELYKNGTSEHPGRSPRRRGKGRKGSSAQQVPTTATTKPSSKVEEVSNDADEEVVRLEGELEVARQDLSQYRPRTRRSKSNQTYIDDDDVEEIPRDVPAADGSSNRHVTLSGSYRIPLPASINTEDLKTIQSGVSAAQNLARTFLEERRAAAALREQQNPSSSNTTTTPSSSQSKKPAHPRPVPKSISSSLEIVKDDEAGGKKSWSEWIGGYSMAISRAVKNIEHEAAVESQPVHSGTFSNSGNVKRLGPQGGGKKAGNKRPPPAKAKVSSEQVEGLMS